MTDRLTALLGDEASSLHIPVPPSAEVITEGRRLRRRHHLTIGLSAAAVLVVIAGIGGVALTGDGDGDTDRVPDPATPTSEAVYAIGSQVYVGDSAATVPNTVHSLHYTSAGVLVRSNPNDGASDGSGPENLTLVKDDGSTVDLGIIPEGVGPATEPGQPYYVLAEAAGSGFEAVVRDARNGEEVTRVGLPDLPPSYWPVPPLALSGDTLYVGYRNKTAAVDWRTGEDRVVDGLPGGLPQVLGDRSVVQDRRGLRVLDLLTGETLFERPFENPDDIASLNTSLTLSPDGSYVLVRVLSDFVEPSTAPTPAQVYDLATGSIQSLAGEPIGWSWSPGSTLFRVDARTMTLCEPATGACTEQRAPAWVGQSTAVRYGGRIYES